MKYKKRPVVIEAVRWDGSNALDILTFAGFDKRISVIFMKTLAF